MTIPLIVLAILSFFAFYSFNPFGASSGWFYHAMERPESVVPQHVQAASIGIFEEALHHAHLPAMILSLTVAGLGILLAFVTYRWKKINADALAERFAGAYRFLLNKWYFDELYGSVVVGGTLVVTRLLKWFDDKIVDGIVNGTARWTFGASFGFRELWKERNLSAALFLGVGLIGMVWVGWYTSLTLWPASSTFSGGVLAVLGGIGAALLALVVVWTGTGGFDKYVVDGMVNGVAYLSGFFGLILRKFQTGRVQTYIVLVLIGIVVIFFVFG